MVHDIKRTMANICFLSVNPIYVFVYKTFLSRFKFCLFVCFVVLVHSSLAVEDYTEFYKIKLRVFGQCIDKCYVLLTVSCLPCYPRLVSYSLLQELGNSCTGQLH